MIAEQARAEAAVAQLVMLRHDPAAIEWAERAIEHARVAGDRAVEVQAKVERASALLARTNREGGARRAPGRSGERCRRSATACRAPGPSTT